MRKTKLLLSGINFQQDMLMKHYAPGGQQQILKSYLEGYTICTCSTKNVVTGVIVERAKHLS